MRKIMAFLVVFAFHCSAMSNLATACPLCKDALQANADDDVEGINFPAAMNESIYLMLGVPYTTLAILGFFVYRGMQKNAAFTERVESRSDLEVGTI